MTMRASLAPCLSAVTSSQSLYDCHRPGSQKDLEGRDPMYDTYWDHVDLDEIAAQ